MAKPFGIAALVFAILFLVVPFGPNFVVGPVAVLCATVAALAGDRVFSIVTSIVYLVGYFFLSPVTLAAIGGATIASGNEGNPIFVFLGGVPGLLPLIGIALNATGRLSFGRQIAAS